MTLPSKKRKTTMADIRAERYSEQGRKNYNKIDWTKKPKDKTKKK
jgi:hypothetical protein